MKSLVGALVALAIGAVLAAGAVLGIDASINPDGSVSSTHDIADYGSNT